MSAGAYRDGAGGYVESLAGETPLLARVRERCEREGLPNVSAATGRLLATLARATRADRVLEVGCLYGYSALWLASARPGTRVDTVEMDEENAAVAESHFREAGVADRVTVRRGRALDVLPTLRGPYDLVFLDAAKAEYVDYLAHALRMLRPGGVLAADNVIWSGRVWDSSVRDEDTVGIRRFTEAVLSNADLSTSIVPVGDGLSVSVLAER